jgi:hypothetical protein
MAERKLTEAQKQRLVKDMPFKDVLKYGMYTLNWPFAPEHKCNMCGFSSKDGGKVLLHIVQEHMEDVLPDVDPGPDGDEE